MSGLREAVEALADEWDSQVEWAIGGTPRRLSDCENLSRAQALRRILAAHPAQQRAADGGGEGALRERIAAEIEAEIEDPGTKFSDGLRWAAQIARGES